MLGNWSEREVKLIVEDYFSMLIQEIQGHPYNKSAHRRILRKKLNSRSESSIERKHQNISAVLIEMGIPYISGYKPLKNYQRYRLPPAILDFISENPEVDEALASDAEKASTPLNIEDILSILSNPPEKREFPGIQLRDERVGYGVRNIDYIAIEAANQKLGFLGEKFVLEFERARLMNCGKSALADKIEQVSVTKGDSAGYDIHSYEVNGVDRFIEVKTTKYGKQTPFFLTVNELNFSRKKRQSYRLYRVFEFRRNPHLFMKPGALDDNFQIAPVQYMARL